ncbi:hypothetical protein PRIPAC_84912, partial [Pristionchus pacificus]|uniref:G_PROTEIN_RECEP_F1_2 domain-containing protein n=1 Tax=Pristionchus pacificus TaxID=54126 RepID=A0A2A6BML7_PRIPA
MAESTPECTSVLVIPNDSPVYEYFEGISEWTGPLFQYLCTYLGPVNILVNIFVMFILTRKELRSPYNLVFFLLALDQTIVIGIWTISMYKNGLFSDCSPSSYSQFWTVFVLITQLLIPTCKAHAAWLVVIIATMRVVSIRMQGSYEVTIMSWAVRVKNSSRHSAFSLPRMMHVLLSCLVALIFVLFADFPNYLAFRITWIPLKGLCENEKYSDQLVPVVIDSPSIYDNNCLILRLRSLLTGTLFIALPGLLLVARKERGKIVKRSSKESTDGDRTTYLLILIMISTMISEIPKAIVFLFEGLISLRMQAGITSKIAPLVISFMLITTAGNLFIYLSMSKKFRE